HGDATLLQQAPEQLSRKCRRIFDRERLVGAFIVDGHLAPKGQRGGARLAIEKDAPCRARGRGHDSIVDTVVVGKWNDGDECSFARAIRGQNIHEHHIVINRERRNRSAVAPYQVILAPAFAIALKREVGIIGHQVTVNVLHALLYQAVGEVLEHLDGMFIALGAKIVGQLAYGEIRIAASNQTKIAAKAAMLVEKTIGLDRRSYFVT